MTAESLALLLDSAIVARSLCILGVFAVLHLPLGRISILPPCPGARTFLSAATLEAPVAYGLLKSRCGRKLLRTGMSALPQQCQDATLPLGLALTDCWFCS